MVISALGQQLKKTFTAKFRDLLLLKVQRKTSQRCYRTTIKSSIYLPKQKLLVVFEMCMQSHLASSCCPGVCGCHVISIKLMSQILYKVFQLASNTYIKATGLSCLVSISRNSTIIQNRKYKAS